MSSDCNVKVMCRIRPLNQKELAANDKAVVSAPTDTQISQGVRNNAKSLHDYVYILTTGQDVQF